VDGQRLVSKISHVIRNDRDRPLAPTKLINITILRIPGVPAPAE